MEISFIIILQDYPHLFPFLFFTVLPSIIGQIKGSFHTSEIVLKPLNIILPEIVSGLDLDEDEETISGIGNPVAGTAGDIHRHTGRERHFVAVHLNQRLSLDEMPVLGAPAVGLEAGPFAGVYDNPFDFVGRGLAENLIGAPGALILEMRPVLHRQFLLTGTDRSPDGFKDVLIATNLGIFRANDK